MSHHGLVRGVTHDLPDNIKQLYATFPSVCSILLKVWWKSKSYAWSEVKISLNTSLTRFLALLGGSTANMFVTFYLL